MTEEIDNPLWHVHRFDALSNRQIYEMMKLRVDVFVVEQACIYPEVDEKDILPNTLHLLGYRKDVLVAYARIIAPVDENASVTIGRVVTHSAYRGRGIARELMDRAMKASLSAWPTAAIGLSAQTQVRGFYESLGFNTVSEEYVEDGIPHIDMLCQLV